MTLKYFAIVDSGVSEKVEYIILYSILHFCHQVTFSTTITIKAVEYYDMWPIAMLYTAHCTMICHTTPNFATTCDNIFFHEIIIFILWHSQSLSFFSNVIFFQIQKQSSNNYQIALISSFLPDFYLKKNLFTLVQTIVSKISFSIMCVCQWLFLS